MKRIGILTLTLMFLLCLILPGCGTSQDSASVQGTGNRQIMVGASSADIRLRQ